MPTNQEPIALVIFDIGGVLAVVDKTSLENLLDQRKITARSFFNDDFYAFQRGAITAQTFVTKKCQQISVDPNQFSALFCDMIDATTGAFLTKLVVPYLLFSNINELHFNAFCRQITISKFAKTQSLLSFQQGLLKPDPRIFALLQKKISHRAVLFLDDKPANVLQARKLKQNAELVSPTEVVSLLCEYKLINEG